MIAYIFNHIKVKGFYEENIAIFFLSEKKKLRKKKCF